jgi:hypothetical protein
MVGTQVTNDARDVVHNEGTLALRLDPAIAQRVAHAARLTRRSPDAFVRWATDLASRSVVLEDAVRRYRRGERSLSELADESGLAVEELMDAVAAAGGVGDRPDAGPSMFLASVRSAMESLDITNLMHLATQATGTPEKPESKERPRRRASSGRNRAI